MLNFNKWKPGCINIQFGRLMNNYKKNEIFHLKIRFNNQVKWFKGLSNQNILIYVELFKLNPVIFNPEDFYKSPFLFRSFSSIFINK